MYEAGERLLRNFPVQATISVIDESDSDESDDEEIEEENDDIEDDIDSIKETSDSKKHYHKTS